MTTHQIGKIIYLYLFILHTKTHANNGISSLDIVVRFTFMLSLLCSFVFFTRFLSNPAIFLFLLMIILGLVSILELAYLCIKFKCGQEIKALLKTYNYQQIIERSSIDLEKARLEHIKPNFLSMQGNSHKTRKI